MKRKAPVPIKVDNAPEQENEGEKLKKIENRFKMIIQSGLKGDDFKKAIKEVIKDLAALKKISETEKLKMFSRLLKVALDCEPINTNAIKAIIFCIQDLNVDRDIDKAGPIAELLDEAEKRGEKKQKEVQAAVCESYYALMERAVKNKETDKLEKFCKQFASLNSRFSQKQLDEMNRKCNKMFLSYNYGIELKVQRSTQLGQSGLVAVAPTSKPAKQNESI